MNNLHKISAGEGYWINRFNDKIPINQLSDEHIRNIIHAYSGSVVSHERYKMFLAVVEEARRRDINEHYMIFTDRLYA